MALPSRVLIREVGPREGFQALPSSITTAKKLSLIDVLGRTGVSEIEVAAFVRPDRVPQMSDAAEIARQFKREKGVQYSALYLNRKGFEFAEQSGAFDNRAWIYASASEGFLSANSNTSTEEQLASVPDWIELFQKHQRPLHGLMLSMAFGSHEDGKVSIQQLLKLLERFMRKFEEHGEAPSEISLADTVGFGNPNGVREAVEEISSAYPDPKISLHLHDTRGTGLVNAYAGLLAGVQIFESSVGGLGGCPFARGAAGNIATEDLVYLFHEIGVETGIDLDAYVSAAQLAEEITGEPLPGRYYRAAQGVQ